MPVADLTLRRAGTEIAGFAADLFTALHPDDAQDPTLMRHWWETQDPAWTWERFLVERAGSAVGYAHYRHAPWERMPERFGGIQADLLPEARTPERLDALFAAMEERSRAEGARRFVAWAWEHDAPRLQVLAGRGYREERRERFWELDLAKNRERLLAMAEQSRDRMREEGIEIITLDRIDDPEKLRKLWRMSEEAEQDVPTTVPHIGTPFETFTKWFESPGLRADCIWIARRGSDIVGISMLSFPPIRGVVVTDWTGSARSVRGRGVARALKCETVVQAIALGVDRVRTDNDGQNAPILHLNETMGYVRRADMIQLIKDVER
jgi:hypothetical protein